MRNTLGGGSASRTLSVCRGGASQLATWQRGLVVTGFAAEAAFLAAVAVGAGANVAQLIGWTVAGAAIVLFVALRYREESSPWYLLVPVGFYAFQVLAFRQIRPDVWVTASGLGVGLSLGLGAEELFRLVSAARRRGPTQGS